MTINFYIHSNYVLCTRHTSSLLIRGIVIVGILYRIFIVSFLLCSLSLPPYSLSFSLSLSLCVSCYFFFIPLFVAFKLLGVRINIFRSFCRHAWESSCRTSAIWLILRIVHIKIIKTDAIGSGVCICICGAADVFHNFEKRTEHSCQYRLIICCCCYIHRAAAAASAAPVVESLSHEHIFSQCV